MIAAWGLPLNYNQKTKQCQYSAKQSCQKEERKHIVNKNEVNKQNSDTDCALRNPSISLAEATIKPDHNDKPLEEHMQSFENRLQALSKEFAANMSTVNNILWEHSNELKQINNPHPDSELTALKKENLELKNQNKDLTNRIIEQHPC